MGDWTSYRPADFVPYTADAWIALVERAGEDLWPLHVVTLALGLAMPWAVRAGHGRVVLVLLAALWAWVGWAFLMQRYAVLNWAGEWLGWAFVVQALVLVLLAVGWWEVAAERRKWGVVQWMGTAIFLLGLVVIPLITVLDRGRLLSAEAFGIHSDPTVVATIGIAMMALRARAMAIAMIIPTLWCVVSGIHLRVLDAGWPAVPFAAAFVAVLVTVLRALRRPA